MTEKESFGYSLAMKNGKELHLTWENLCKKCGLCCFEKIEDEQGTIFFTSIPCRYLDVVTRECRIYPRRFEIYPDCIKLTEDLVRKLPWLHDDCGYREALGVSKKRNPARRKVTDDE